MDDISDTILKVDNTVCIQEHFLGVNAIYHAFLHSKHFPERQYTKEECKTELDRVKSMNLHIARTFFEPCAYENGKWDWDNEKMQSLYTWLSEMKECGVDVALNACWWLGGHVFLDEKSPFYDANPQKAAEKYGAWVSEAVHQIVEVRGYTNVRYLLIFTEPNAGVHDIIHKYPKLSLYEPYELCVRAAHRKLIDDGRRSLVKLVGPNEGLTDTGDPSMMKWACHKLSNCLDIFSVHNYLDDSFDDRENWETHDGIYSVRFSNAGYRAQQRVKLETNKEYELSIYLKAAGGSLTKKWERNVLFGAFETREGEGRLISGGGEGISYLTENSVAAIPCSDISCEWKKYTMHFFSGDKDYAYIGIYYDIIPFGATIYVDTVSLKEVGTDWELLENGNFEDTGSDAWVVFKTGLGHLNETMAEYSFWNKLACKYMKLIPHGKDYWFDEYNARYCDIHNDSQQGIALAVAQAAFINAGVANSMLWSLFDQYWPMCRWDGFDNFVDGDHRWGLAPVLKRSAVPCPAFYSFSLMSKYLGDGDSRVFKGDARGNLCVSFVQGKDGNYGILIVNTGNEIANFTVRFEKELNVKLYRYLYNSLTVKPDGNAKIITADLSFEEVKHELCDSIPARCMAIYSTKAE